MRGAHRQRGVALITAMLIVALAVILATQIGFDSAIEQQRTTTGLLQEQAFQVGMGAEAWAASFLQEDLQGDQSGQQPQDHFAETWAMPMPPIPIDGGYIEGRLEDLQGRFNVNNLLLDSEDDKYWRTAFQHLLVSLELEPKWAAILRDWLDADGQQEFPDGAEDNVYTAMTPPYRTANTAITSVSELLSLPDFGLERYNKLKPYVAALPVPSQINVCTAPGVVIDALTGGDEYARVTEEIARDREERCFPTLQTLLAVHPDQPQLQQRLTEQTQYFRLRAFVTIGAAEFSLYSLLWRAPDGGGKVRVIMRSFGAE